VPTRYVPGDGASEFLQLHMLTLMKKHPISDTCNEFGTSRDAKVNYSADFDTSTGIDLLAFTVIERLCDRNHLP
jgi:hypothetical protein